jgi:2,5-diketo-D-gluconate reductase A
MDAIDEDTRVELHTGRTMPIIGLGTWNLTHSTAALVSHALHLGYPMIDTSGDYGTQPGIAEGVKKAGVSRESLYIVTKVENTDDGYEATKRNLAELQLSYADLVLIHHPPEEGVGEEIWRGLVRARRAGLVKDIGVSNYSETQIETLANITGVMPVVNQIEWSPFGWSQSMLEFCEENGIIIQAYSPLAQGKRLYDSTLAAIAKKYGKDEAQVMIRWALQTGVVPLPKANQLQHLRANLDVFDFELEDKDMEKLRLLNEQYSALSDRPIYDEEQ